MYIIQSFNDGSVSYAYEAGDKVILNQGMDFYDLHGNIYKSYEAGDTVTISRRIDNKFLPDCISLYSIGGLEYLSTMQFKPADLRKLRKKPKIFVVAWKEENIKYTLVAARNKKEAIKRTFAYTYFTPERMKGIKVEYCEIQNENSPKKFISMHPLN